MSAALTTTAIRRVCFPDGMILVGVARPRHRAVCHCGYPTTPRSSAARAIEALLAEHGFTNAPCGICGQTADASEPWQVLRPLDDGEREVYVCRDTEACRRRYAEHVAADTLRCGCSHVTVAVVGHYHEVTP